MPYHQLIIKANKSNATHISYLDFKLDFKSKIQLQKRNELSVRLKFRILLTEKHALFLLYFLYLSMEVKFQFFVPLAAISITAAICTFINIFPKMNAVSCIQKLTANSSGVTLSMSNTTASKLLAESKLRPSRDSELLLSCRHRRKTIRLERDRKTQHIIRVDISNTYKIHMDREPWPVALFLWIFNQFNYHCPFELHHSI